MSVEQQSHSLIAKTHFATIASKVNWFAPDNTFCVTVCVYRCALTAQQGAQTTIFCAVDETVSNSSGKYYENCQERKTSKLAMDDDLARRVYDLTLKSLSEFTEKNPLDTDT